jgi:hypothetical protein
MEEPERDATTGICLSGGGLRAAAFSLGVLQVLQRERGLLFGERAADWLAAVSGGSYTAGAQVLGGRQRASHPERYSELDPLAEGSPEEEHVLHNGRYLLDRPWQWPWLWALTFSSLVVLFIWAGFMLADTAALATYLPNDLEMWLGDLPAVLPVAGVFVAFALLSASLYTDSRLRRALLALAGIPLLYLSSQPAIEWASRLDELASWSDAARTAGQLVLVLVALAAATMLMRKLQVVGLPASVLNLASAAVTRLLGLVILARIAIEWYPDLKSVFADEPGADTGKLALAFAATLVAPLLFSSLPARASLHREYRRRLESCFAVARGADGGREMLPGKPLSTAPPDSGELRFPQLLVCATANVRWRGPDGRRWTFRPFVLSHDLCAVPGDQDAAFATEKLELGREPAGVVTASKEPLISLFTAVAATGAALAPSMGRYTVASARVLIAGANFRLGRWIPNPYSTRARHAVATKEGPGKFDKDGRLGSGYDELIPEMLGLYGPRVYLSDGGHYDNLGLLELLRRGPDTVWCVDASPDPRGEAKELRRVLDIARTSEPRIDVAIDCGAFERGADGFYPATHVEGDISYPGGRKGRLIVLKLGLVASSDADLRRLRGRWSFPFHPTPRQVYDSDRMDAYRRLGQEVAKRALGALGAS